MRLSSSNIVMWLSQLVRTSTRLTRQGPQEVNVREQQMFKCIVDAFVCFLPPHDKLLPTIASINEAIFRCRRYVVVSRLASIRGTIAKLMHINQLLGNEHSLIKMSGPRFIRACDVGDREIQRITALWTMYRSTDGISDVSAYRFWLSAALDELCELHGVNHFADTLVDGALFGSSPEVSVWCADILAALDVSLCCGDLDGRLPRALSESVENQS